MIELKPCPFCGGKAEIEKIVSWYEVSCSNCGTRSTIYKQPSEAINAWNKRTNTIPIGNGENYEVTQNG